ncbi:hypothetical protein AB1Y20_005366 [Prymnesium parvum]|uniref:Uncharacterized protein n=1 Tax=Prymnesium parvum TaxID=97485 RepID=A0AB34J3Y5_PRYPA
MLSLLSAAPAFTAPLSALAPQRAVSVRMGVESMEGLGPETLGKVFDPLNLSTMASDKTLAWYRHAELKHGRVAMAAFVGWLWVNGGAPLFGGAYSFSGATFESLGHDSFAAWDALPTLAKAQIFLTIGGLEFCSELAKPHYMAGGTPGKVTILGNTLAPSTNLLPSDASAVASKRVSELKNGRLAMIGIMGVIAAHYVPGSVPAL